LAPYFVGTQASEMMPTDIASGLLPAGVFFALFEESDDKVRQFLRFIPEFAECFLVGCAPVRW
jgi:hypothetical protein